MSDPGSFLWVFVSSIYPDHINVLELEIISFTKSSLFVPTHLESNHFISSWDQIDSISSHPIITRNQSVSATLSHINVQSSVNKTSSFHEYITDLSPTICALMETWLSNDEADLRFKDVPPKGYSIISRP